MLIKDSFFLLGTALICAIVSYFFYSYFQEKAFYITGTILLVCTLWPYRKKKNKKQS